VAVRKNKALVKFAEEIGAYRSGRYYWYDVAKVLAEMYCPELLREGGAMTGGGGRRKQNDDEALATELQSLVWQHKLSLLDACRALAEGRVPASRPRRLVDPADDGRGPDVPEGGTWFRDEPRWKGIAPKTLRKRYYNWQKAEQRRLNKLPTVTAPEADESGPPESAELMRNARERLEQLKHLLKYDSEFPSPKSPARKKRKRV
jgi:hypothetical protein